MISLVLKFFKQNYKEINNLYKKQIEIYDKYIKNTDSGKIKCPKCNHYHMIKHSSYNRTYIDSKGNSVSFRVQRYYCKVCGTTHALLPSFVVPYKRKTLIDLIDTITEYVEHNNYVSEDNYIIDCFIKWQSRLKSLNITRKNTKDEQSFFRRCTDNFKMFYLQFKRRHYRNKGKLYEVICSSILLTT